MMRETIVILKMKFEDLTRRNIRYICFRLQTEATGGAKAKKEKEGIMAFVDKIKEHMEDQEDFGGWDKFAKTWDVDEKSPLVAVKRNSSIQTEWNKILKEETKELPVTVSSSPAPRRTPMRDAHGKFVGGSNQSILEPPAEEEDSPSKKKSFWDVLK